MYTFALHRCRGAASLFVTAVFLITAVGISPALAQVSVTTLGTPYTQNFDTLPASGSATWTNNSTVPGWFHARTGTGTTIVAIDGSSNAGNLYSFGTGTSTDRALGSVGNGNAAVGNLFWGVRLQNNTGATITSLEVAFTGEQWRNSAAAAQTLAFSYLVGSPVVTGSLAEFQSAGVAVPSLDFTSPITGGVAGAIDGNLAANRVSVTFTITGLSVPNGTEIMLRWSDPDHTVADHGLSIDNFSVTPQGGTPLPTLSVSDVALTEGNPPGTNTFTFAVTLSSPAGPGGVTFDIATADGTAQDDNPPTEDNDYVAQSLTGQSIASGSTGPYNFSVTVNRDATAEPNETFFVNVTNITGATAGDTQGQGTINNDDVTLTPIHDIQGPGNSSPIVGATVTSRGIVTAVRANGFFIQEDDATVDADPATSEGIFVLTTAAPPAAAVTGARVQVTGTVTEFVPISDPLQPPLTELTFPAVTQLATAQPLPTAIALTSTFPDPAGPYDQLERLEGMRVAVASLTVVGPTGGSIDEVNATSSSDGVFQGVITGVARPFREAGIQAPDPPPSGTIPPIPRWDANPERLRVDSDAISPQPALSVKTGDVVTGLVGPLDYSSRGYTILPEAAVTVTPGPSLPSTVTAAVANEVTVASFNLQRFFDTVDDPAIGEPVLTPAAYATRLAKASIAIREHLLTPDIIGVQEVENLSTLQAIAAEVNGVLGPQYDAFVVEGNDADGLDVGILVKTADTAGGPARVSVVSVTQELGGELFVNPDTSTEPLWERPPLILQATVSRAGVTWPVTVIVAHPRTAEDSGNVSPGSNGWPTQGARSRARRQEQAESLANYIQSRQTADPAEHLVVLGDFDALGVNDGFVDVMNVLAGTPPPDNQTAVPGDGVDLVNPDLANLRDTPPAAQRYSQVGNGHAEAAAHVLVNQATVTATAARRIEFARIGADYPETERSSAATAFRLSDHDPVIVYLAASGLVATDVAIAVTDLPDPVARGSQLTYTTTVTNNGPDAAADAAMNDPLPAGTTFVSLSAPAGWSCSTPPVGAGGTVTCTIASMPVGAAVFTLSASVSTSIASGTVLSNTATVATTTADTVPANNTGTATTATVNVLPTITAIADQTIPRNTSTPALAFTIGDLETPAAILTVSGSSSNPTIVPDANIVFGGSGAARTVVVTPAANQHGGPVTITVTVNDDAGSASVAFSLTVTSPGNEPPTLTGLIDATMEETTTLSQTLTVGDDATAVDALTVTVTSSNQALVPDSAVVLTGAGAMRTLTLTPVDEQVGETIITVNVSDGELTTTQTARFVITAAPPPEAPTGVIAAASGNEVTISWVAPAAGATPTFYVLEGGSAPGATTLPVVNTRARGTQWAVTLPGGTYFLRVRSANRAGISDRSNEATIVVNGPAALPGPPGGFVAAVTGSRVSVQWAPGTTGSQVDGWQIELGSAPRARDLGIFQVAPGVTTAAGSIAAGEYYLRVRGVNAAGEGPASHDVRIRVGPIATCEVPEAPVLLPATNVDRFVQLTWRESRNTAVATYRVLVGSQPGLADLAMADVGAVNAFAALAPPGEYFVSVLAINDCGTSAASNVVRVEVSAAPPAPANLRAGVDGRRAGIAWDAVPRVDGYVVEVGSAPGLADLASVPTTGTSYIVDGAPSGTYYVRVRSVRAGLRSEPSGEVQLVVP